LKPVSPTQAYKLHLLLGDTQTGFVVRFDPLTCALTYGSRLSPQQMGTLVVEIGEGSHYTIKTWGQPQQEIPTEDIGRVIFEDFMKSVIKP
jgi:hypothetical protein